MGFEFLAKPRHKFKKKFLSIIIVMTVISILSLIMCTVSLFHSGSVKASCSEKISELDSEIDDINSQLDDARQKLTENASVIEDYSRRLFNTTDPANAKVCYLTFDDGPSDNTLEILKVLDKYKVKATFFVIGASKLEYLPKIAEKGHTIGLHSYSHNYETIYRGEKEYMADLDKISNAVKEKTGIESKVIRFPGGSSNTISEKYCKKIMSNLVKKVSDKGYAYFDWNCDSGDADGNNIPADKLIENVKNTSKDKQKITVLMHDTDAKKTTTEALPKIIEYLQSQGYSFEPLTTASPAAHHSVNN